MIRMNKIKRKRYHDKTPYEINYFFSGFNLNLYLAVKCVLFNNRMIGSYQ